MVTPSATPVKPSDTQLGQAPKRAALYLRVSRDSMTFENQRPELVQQCRTRGFEIVAVFEEKASAAKTRPEFDRMMVAAHQNRFDVLLVWSLDRFGRSMAGNLSAVLKLDGLGIATMSVREPWLATEGPTRGLLIAVFSWVAEQERLRISERTKVALDRVRADGRKLGRPRAQVDIARALVLIEGKGHSLREAAKILGVGASTLHRLLAQHREMLNSEGPFVPKTAVPPAPCSRSRATGRNHEGRLRFSKTIVKGLASVGTEALAEGVRVEFLP